MDGCAPWTGAGGAELLSNARLSLRPFTWPDSVTVQILSRRRQAESDDSSDIWFEFSLGWARRAGEPPPEPGPAFHHLVLPSTELDRAAVSRWARRQARKVRCSGVVVPSERVVREENSAREPAADHRGGDAATEVCLLGNAAHVLERQDYDRRVTGAATVGARGGGAGYRKFHRQGPRRQPAAAGAGAAAGAAAGSSAAAVERLGRANSGAWT